MWSEQARQAARENQSKVRSQSVTVKLTTAEFDLILLCIYNTEQIIQRRIARNADPRDSVGDAKRIWELGKVKKKLMERKGEE